jgi:predicted extracellular nuclease
VLVAALNRKEKNKTWSYIDTGVLGEDVIKVGFIYQNKHVMPVGEYKVLNPKVMPEFEADKNRDVLLQTFKDANDNLFNVAVLHLKSKRCSDALGLDLDQEDGQGCYNASRVKVAEQISDWLKQDPTGYKAASTLVIGDFNSYLKEDPISTFAKNSFSNLANDLLTPENWTSIFRGEVGSIDHILANTKAREAAKGMTQWHINSIVMGWFDYNLEELAKSKAKPKNYYNEGPFASSDHDMVIAGFTFDKSK